MNVTVKTTLTQARTLIVRGEGDVTYSLAVSADEDTFTPALEALYKAAGSPVCGSRPWDKVNVLIDWNDQREPQEWVRLYDLALRLLEQRDASSPCSHTAACNTSSSQRHS